MKRFNPDVDNYEFLTPRLWKTFWVIYIHENKQLCIFAEKNIA